MPDLPTYENLREEALNWRHVSEQFLNARDVTVNAMHTLDEQWKASHGAPDSVEDALKYLQAKWVWRIEILNDMARTAPGYSEGWAMGLLQALGEVIKVSRMMKTPTLTHPHTSSVLREGEEVIPTVGAEISW